ncbi:vegetatible incompatibility het-e-1 [Fusarium pseudoanthophilum]|uniref:Vegetatible incompatibility het-e-1 n=1 Tax=Fusarium pseudoanthophilum TaxID=48495 RepID=A0A8H5PNA6_9HYPO|nr:vegetatible incompatibility het-e-1 [Fusarium pseudoanthophilum]
MTITPAGPHSLKLSFIRRLNPGKGNESSSGPTGTAASTPLVSQDRVSASLPSTSASLRSVPPVSVAGTKDSLPENVSVGSSAPPAEHASTISTTDYECNEQQRRFQQLWKDAIDTVQASKDGEKLSEVIRAQEQSSAEDAQITLPDLIKRLETEMKRFGTRKRLAEAMEKIVPHLNRFAVVGDIAVSTNPNPAALPWAANLTAGEEIRGKVVEGIAEITVLVFECSVYHELYLASSASTDLPINANIRRTITDALSHCIRFLGFALRRQQAAAKAFTDAFRLEDFTGYLKALNVSKEKLHDAGSLCEIHHSSQSRDQLRSLHDLMVDMRLESSERAQERIKSQLRNLLVDPKDVFDHIYHPHDSFCLVGTRVQVLHDIEQWAHDPSSPTICWLPGLAGTGKSTISRTISRNIKTKSLGASFFFKKGAGNRGNGRHLFSILAYQLALSLPPILQYILEAVKEDHSLNMAPIQVQWQKLILSPLSKLQDEGLAKPIVFVLDALDECDEQDRGEIFRVLLATCPVVLRVFLTSRPELDIMGHFVNEPLHKEIVLHKLHIGTIESDFRVYLRQAMESFVVEYNRTHRQKHMQLSSDWPGDERFELLLNKALPLFIAAATFVRMISDRHWAKSPDSKIDFIINKSSGVNSAYEALYKPVLSLILSGAPDEDKDEVRQSFLDIIGSLVLLASPLPIVPLANLLGVDAWSISSQIDPLRSVIDVPEDDSPLRLFHLSFRDYILSQSAGDLQVSELETQTRLGNRCLSLMRGTLKVDICGISSPGKSLSDIEPSVIDDHLSAEIQYACLYWVHHLKSAGGRIHDEDDAHIFLQGFFSNWLEVLCLLGKLDDALRMLQDLQSMVNSQTLEVVSERLSQLAFLPDNKLASICNMGNLTIWDQRSSSSLLSISHGFKRGFITVLAWYNSRIVAVGWPYMIKIWNLDCGACVRSFSFAGLSGAESIAFSDDGRFICSVCTRGLECVVFMYSLDTGKCVSEFEIPDKPHPILLSSKGQWIAAIAQNSMLLSRWSCSTRPSWTVLGPQHEHDIVRFSSDGSLVASLSSTLKMVKVWSTESYKCLHTLHFETPIVHDQLALNKDWLIVSLRSHRTLVLDMKTGAVSKTVCSYIKAGPVISDDGTLLAGQSLEGAVRIWDLTSMVSTDSTATRQSMGVEMVTPFRDDNTILSDRWGDIKIWDMESGVCKEALEPEVPLDTQTFVAAATEAPVFAILKDTTVEIWNANPLRQVSTFERTFSCLGERYYCLAISSNGERVAVGSSEPGTVEIWDVKNEVLLHILDVPLVDFPCVAFSPDASKIAYLIWGAIEICCLPGLETLTIKTEMEPGKSFIRTLTFRGERLIGVYLNTQVQVWNVSTAESLFLSQPRPELPHFGTGNSFLNLDAALELGADNDVLGAYYIGHDPAWVMRNGERILWLPPDYKPESVYMSGTTMVLGTYSGRVLFLYLKE